MAVFLIPGLWGTKKFYELTQRKFASAGLTVEIMDLGRNYQGLKKTAEKAIRYLKRTKEKDDIIAHSYGGIIFKYVLKHYPEIGDMIRSVTFVAVPHGGTWHALFVSMLPAARELLPFRNHLSDFKNLNLPESTVNFIAESEIKIWPKKNALLEGYIDIAIIGTNHDSIMFSDNFVEKAVAFIKAADSCRPSGK